MNSARTITMATCALALALTQAVHPSQANACVASTCNAGAVLPADGQLPANAVEVLWRTAVTHNPVSDAGTPTPTPHLYRVDGDTRTELPITTEEVNGLVHVKPQQAVAADSTLVFEYDETCGFPTAPGVVSTSFQVGPAAAPPSAIGNLRAEIKQGPVDVNGSGGMCTDSVESVYADLTIDLTDEAEPYADALRHRLLVDGERVASYGYYNGPYAPPDPIGTSILGTGKDRLLVPCADLEDGYRPGAVSEGVHRVQFEVLLPDDTLLTTDTIDVELRCPDALGGGTESGDRADAAVGADDGGPGEAEPESATSDGSVNAADDGGALPATSTADASSPSDAEAISGDDGCSVASDAQGSSSLWLVLLGLVGAGWRRPRHRSHRSQQR